MVIFHSYVSLPEGNGMSQLHQGVSTVGYTNNLQSAIMALGDQFNMVPTAPGLWLALMNNPPF
jgi:hypothetical protein